MTAFFKRVPRTVLRGLPTALTLVVLAGVAFIGHRTGWTIGPASHVFGEAKAPREDWCMDHGVPESTCIICRGLDVGKVPPTQQVKGGSTAQEPAHESADEPIATDGDASSAKPRPAVQLATAETAERAGIRVAPASVQAVAETVEANAEVVYDQTRYAQVSARAPGTAALVRVQAGQPVRKGNILALIDSADVGKAKAELLQAAAQVASRKAVVERITRSTNEGFRNQADLVTAEADLKEASIRLFNARQALVNLGLAVPATAEGEIPGEREILLLGLPADIVAELDAERVTGNLLPVISPLDGSVISRGLVAGEVVESAKPLFVVADTTRMWVHADLTPAQATQVSVGQRLEFTQDVPGAAGAVGTVTWISPEVNPKTRTVQVRAEVPNEERRLFAHSFGRARIIVRESQDAVVVPETALQRDGDVVLVFVKRNDEVFETRAVRLGGSSGGMVEIRSGLRSGERVAVAGSYALAAQLNRGKLGAGCTDD